MDPAIGAALIGLAAAIIGVAGIVLGVAITARKAQEVHRRELVTAAVSEYFQGTQKIVRAAELRRSFSFEPDSPEKTAAHETASALEITGMEIQAVSKVRIIAFADAELIYQLGEWESTGDTGDPATWDALVDLILDLRLRSRVRGSIDRVVAIGLTFGFYNLDRWRSTDETGSSP